MGGCFAGGLAAHRGELGGEELGVAVLGGELGKAGGGGAPGLGGDEVGAVGGQAGEGGQAGPRARVVEPGDESVQVEQVVGGERGEADVGGEVVGEEGVFVGG